MRTFTNLTFLGTRHRIPQTELLELADRINKSPKSQYDYYFRIDYSIKQLLCQPISTFNTSLSIASVQEQTNGKINQLLMQEIKIDIIYFNVLPKNTKRNSASKSICNYIIELHIGFNFSKNCDSTCQSIEIQRLTSKTQPFGSPARPLSLLTLYSSNSLTSNVAFFIQHFYIHRSSKYYHKSVYIQSFYDNRYISAFILDADVEQTSTTMTEIDRNIFISFSSYSENNIYLRHVNGRVTLTKNNQLTLFKQDATFKLIMNEEKNMVAFESINIPEYYIAVDPDSKTALILEKPQKKVLTINDLNEEFLFKFNF
ncbi:unnamed protein product [Adineta steineri]|uniref:Alpha-L-arabinofuranosidase B arabinose-binding domain-containing protein n=1 Tax=Adineta steineri TaxID=433720 RepID=A0A818M312_9BILA|nr:unnamed protein product [Adineta steineri]CAF3588597.1 unnamed protein product [Adineta steineri]